MGNLENRQVVEFFQQHMVPLYFTFQKDGTRQNFLYTAFVIDINDHWFLVTAGHVLREIDDYVQAGYEIEKSRFIDTLPSQSTSNMANPFEYEPEDVFYADADKGMDFGVMAVRNFYRRAMEKNGVVPLNESTWGEPAGKADRYLMLGIPEELSKVSEHKIDFANMIHVVEPLEEHPKWFNKYNTPMFYGRVHLNSAVKSLSGMSGGPILALREIDGKLRYWVHAVQGSWIEPTREIAACKFRPFAQLLKESIREAEDKFGRHWTKDT